MVDSLRHAPRANWTEVGVEIKDAIRLTASLTDEVGPFKSVSNIAQFFGRRWPLLLQIMRTGDPWVSYTPGHEIAMSDNLGGME